MFIMGHFYFLLCICVFCELFVLVLSSDEKRVVFYEDLTMLLDCEADNHVINITAIYVENIDICLNSRCSLKEDQKLEMYQKCNGKTSCSTSSITNDTCLLEFRNFNISYLCEHVGFSIGTQYQCDFDERNLCGWNTPSIGKYTWVLESGKTTVNKTKPDHDHTKMSDSGYYLYTDLTQDVISNDENEVHFFSGEFSPSINWCISFWYYISGCDSGNLQIHQVPTPYLNNSDILWKSTALTESLWKYHQLQINPIDKDYKIYFVAKQTKGTACAIALDDIRLVSDKCIEPMSTNESCKNFDSDSKLEIMKCDPKYQPSDMSLYYKKIDSDCTDEYNTIRSTSQEAFKQCKQPNNGYCNIDITSIVMSKTQCFLANKLVVEYECIDSDETQSLTTIDQSSPSVEISTPMPEEQSTGSHETQSISTIHDPLSLSDEHNTMYIVIGTSLAAIGCIIIFVVSLVLIKRRKMGDKPKKENNKLCNDAQSIQDPSKTNKSQIQLDLVYSSTCDSFVKSKNTDNIPRYAVPSSGYYTTNQITRKENAIYKLPNPVSETDTYAESVDGVYDTSGSRRHVEDSDSIYNHSVDSIYDHTRSEKDMTDNDAMYDRTFTYVTDSLYDVSRR